MEKIKDHKCEYCGKILESYSGMWKHEKKCFWNPQSKSCVTCKYLFPKNEVNEKVLTHEEEQIFGLKVPGTYTIQWNTDPESNGEEYKLLIEKYQYLEHAEWCNYCEAKKCILKRLCTGCEEFKI